MGLEQLLGQHAGVQEAQIHALPGQRMDDVRGVADQRQSGRDVALGVTLAQRDAHARVDFQHLAKPVLEGPAQLDTEGRLVQRHQPFGLGRRAGPDDRAPVAVAVAIQRQEGQRAVIGEALPGGQPVLLGAAHAGDDGVVEIIPLAGLTTGHAPHRRIGAIGGHQQRRLQFAAIGQAHPPAGLALLQALDARLAEQPHRAVTQAVEQGILHHAVLDDVPEHLGMHAGGGEADLSGTRAVPDLHVRIGTAAPGLDARPGAQALQQIATGRRQGADARLERRRRVERPRLERGAVHQQDVQAAVLQGQRQGAADHPGAHDDDVRVHVSPSS